MSLLLLWEAASVTRLLNPFYFPPVHEVARSLFDAALDGRLATALLTSLGRGFAGFAAAAILGVGLGALAGRHLFVRRLIDPIVELLRPLPSPAIIPVAILLLGIDSSMKVFIIGWACFFQILLNTIDGVRSVPPALVDYGLNRVFLLVDRRVLAWHHAMHKVPTP